MKTTVIKNEEEKLKRGINAPSSTGHTGAGLPTNEPNDETHCIPENDACGVQSFSFDCPERLPSRKRNVEVDTDSLFSMLPLANKACTNSLKCKVKKFLKLKHQGQSINGKISQMKDLRNPYILNYLLTRHDLDELGSNYPLDRFDPHGFEPSEFHEELQTAQYDRMLSRTQKSIETSSTLNAEHLHLSGNSKTEGTTTRERRNSTRWDVGGLPPSGILPQHTVSAFRCSQQQAIPKRNAYSLSSKQNRKI